MDPIAEYVVVWALVAIVLIWSQRRWGGGSTGIPVAYFLGLALIHVPGASLYLDPSYAFYDPDIIETGFAMSTLGVVGFAVGVLLGGTRSRLFGRDDSATNHYKSLVAKGTAAELNRLAWFFLGAGFVVQFVAVPLLSSLPLTALLSGLSQLTVVGACLGLHAAHAGGDRARLQQWLGVAAAFPIITVVSAAFIGYGVIALLTVISFAVTLFRPRLWSAIPFAIAVFLGLSIFATYSRDRTEYREAVWMDKATLTERGNRLMETFLNFELFDASNAKHQFAVDERLNQNHLVGAAEAHIAAGRAAFAYGETMWTALLSPIPRILWPDKPEFGGSGDIVASYTGQTFAEGTSVGVGQILEFFINFGWTGVFWCYVVLGAVCRRLDMHAALALRASDFKRFLLYFMPAMGLLQAGGLLAEVVASATAAFFSALAAATLATRYLVRLRRRAREAAFVSPTQDRT